MSQNLSMIEGLDPRVHKERLSKLPGTKINPFGTDYIKHVVKAVTSGQLKPATGTAAPVLGAVARSVSAFAFDRPPISATGSNLQSKIDSAIPGDTILLVDGDHTITDQLRLRAGVKLAGNWAWSTVTYDSITMKVPKPKARLIFSNRPKAGDWPQKQCFAVSIPANASDVVVEGLEIESNNGIFFLEGNLSNISVVHCGLRWGYNGNYYSRLAFYTGGPVNGLTIEENYFHDSELSDRNMEIWSVTGLRYDYNIFYRVNDGGHFMNLGPDCSYSFNYGRLIHRMGCEVQQDRWPGPDPKNMVVQGNVFYDWNKPYWDSMGMSIPSYAGTSLKIRNNYVRVNAYNNLWGEADSSGTVRGSFLLECPQGPGGLVENNILGGERAVGGMVRPGDNCTIGVGNEVYGTIAWYNNNPVGGEPGSSPGNPTGSVAFVKYSTKLSDMPAPPIQPFKGTDPIPPDPPPTGNKMQLSATGYTTFARVTVSGSMSGTAGRIQWRGKDQVWRELKTTANQPASFTSLPVTLDVVDPMWKPNWELWFRGIDNLGPSAEVYAQLNKPDPVTPPPANKGVVVTTTTETTLDANNAVVGTPKVVTTTKPVQ